MGYDVGFIKDEYGCNSNECECAHFNDAIIGKLDFVLIVNLKPSFRRHCCFWKNGSEID